MLSRPRHCTVHECLGKDDHIAGFDFYLTYIMSPALPAAHLVGHVLGKIALVAARHAAKPTVARPGVAQAISKDGQAVAHYAVVILVPVVAGLHIAVHHGSTVQPPGTATLLHKDAVVVVYAHVRAEQLRQIGHNIRMVHQALRRRPPLRYAASAPDALLVVLARPRRIG